MTSSRGPAPVRQPRGQARADALVRACADLMLEQGPTAVSHRAVAARADLPLASTTYYFASLDELIGAAGALLVGRWEAAAIDVVRDEEAVRAATTPRLRAALLVRAVLPDGDDDVVRSHYEHLVWAGRAASLAAAYAAGRARFDGALGDLLGKLGSDLSAQVVIALVDGVAVTALSEAEPVRPKAVDLLTEFLTPQ